MLDFTRALTVPSALRYLAWRAGGGRAAVPLRARCGARFEIRPNGLGRLGNNDYGVAYEIFSLDLYRVALEGVKRDEVRLVVDLGANVGLSALWFLNQFPACRVLAFEPHPSHAAQARRNWALGGVAERVELVEAGAGTRTRMAVLSDRGSGSTVAAEGDGLSIEIRDAFPHLTGRPIDLMKIDMEGGEYELLADPRFAGLDVRAIVMEWHARGEQGLAWCLQRLNALGYVAEPYATGPDNGMIWARRA
ncbi:methyltransferase, FkbM family [Roseomonas rosea]|uniref:Methyltransferase, FkbM family n=1 Tax=Muricoccus roseus TaxID=198092 RepID=A0A1M6AN27_9PROT|nr:FkbM family methyltransferase [Roseomonas rosea]SHI37872.1 methyltransferase, FkbM family [Roseomonas rosea]